MASVFITGSNDGLGRDAARRLAEDGHEVVGHARSEQKAEGLRSDVPEIADVLVADLSSMEQVRRLAAEANAHGAFDAVIHNAGVGYQEPERIDTAEGHAHVLAINALTPYLLTALIEKPARLIYLTSGLYRQGDTDLSDIDWLKRSWSGMAAYSDSKLFDATLAAAVARLWPDVISNSVSPGWVATKMGGPSAPDDYEAGSTTQVWLATSDDEAALQSGRSLYHQEPADAHPAVNDEEFQADLLDTFAKLTGTELD